MELKGMEQFRKHLPEMQTASGRIRLALTFFGFFILVTLFFLAVDCNFAEWMPDGEIVVMSLGFLVMSLFFSRKKLYQQRYGDLAYRNALFHYGIPGLATVAASIAHLAYMAGPVIPGSVWWRPILMWIGWFLIIISVGLWFRSVLVFGADYLSLVYVYFPQEGRLVNSSIYSMLRHPVYSAALNIGIGLALISANWYSLLVAVLLPLGFTGWIRLFEEKELIERFGQSYLDYRKSTPAFWVKPQDLVKFFRFLISGQ